MKIFISSFGYIIPYEFFINKFRVWKDVYPSHEQFFKFLPFVFLQNKFFTLFIFVKVSLDQFYSFTCTIHLYRFYHNFYRSHVLFLKFLALVFLQKNFFVQFLFFCKFSYLDQFYSFTCTINLYRFYHNVYPSHGQILSFFLFIFYRNKLSLMRTPI